MDEAEFLHRLLNTMDYIGKDGYETYRASIYLRLQNLEHPAYQSKGSEVVYLFKGLLQDDLQKLSGTESR